MLTDSARRPADRPLNGPYIAALLVAARFRYRNEVELHDGMTAYLRSKGVTVRDDDREVILSGADRIDFLLDDGLGIEVKVAGRPGDVLRQLARYATHDRVRELLLVTTRLRLGLHAPTELNGKPLTVMVMRGGLR